jgi:MFS family permease
MARRICQPAVMLARDMTTTDAPALLFSSAPGRWVVAVTVLGSGIAALDATVVNIALPTIGREFHVGVSALQWVMSGYTLTLAAFLLIGGSLGDRSAGGRCTRSASCGLPWPRRRAGSPRARRSSLSPGYCKASGRRY